MSKLTLYMASVSSNMELKKRQQKIKMILDSMKIEYEEIDITAGDKPKAEMREIAGDPTCLPPQIANGTTYCGDFGAFDEAVECEALKEFLRI